MKEETKLKFIRWAKAKLAVQENSQLLVQKLDPVEYKKIVMLCDQRFEDLFVAETSIRELEDDRTPPEYRRWLASKSSLPCTHCWVRDIKLNHPECDRKLGEYFSAEEALYEYVLNDMI